MDNTELEEVFGTEFCDFFTFEILRQLNIRLRLNIRQFKQQILNAVTKTDDLQTNLISPSFWISLIDELNSKYTIDGIEIIKNLNWVQLVELFFEKIWSNGKIIF